MAIPADQKMPIKESSRIFLFSDEVGKAQASERSVGNSAADEHHPFGNNVGADQSAADTDQDGTEQGILKKIVF